MRGIGGRFEWKRANPLGALKQMRNYPGIGWVCAVMFLFWLAHAVYPAVWSFVSTYRYGWSEGQIGLSLGIYGIGAAFVMGVILPKIVPVLGEWKTAVLDLSFPVVGLTGYAFAWEGWMVYVVIVLTVMENVADPPLRSIAAGKVPPSAQGELQGALTSLSSITTIIGPLIFTQLFGYFTKPDAPVHLCRCALSAVGHLHPDRGHGVLRRRCARLRPQRSSSSRRSEPSEFVMR